MIGYRHSARDRAAAAPRDGADQPDRETAAAFGALLPVRRALLMRAHHFAGGEQRRPSRSTRKRQRGASSPSSSTSARFARQQRLHELHLRQAQRAERPVQRFDRIEHAVEHHHAGHDGSTREMPGQAGMVGRYEELHGEFIQHPRTPAARTDYATRPAAAAVPDVFSFDPARPAAARARTAGPSPAICARNRRSCV